MDERVLRSFATIAEIGNLTLAAVRLNMTQSALTRQIQKLEMELGVQLFERMGRKLRLSREGDVLLSRVQSVLAASRKMHETAAKLRQGEVSILRVGACSQVIERYFPDILSKWRAINPTIEIKVEEGGGADLSRALGDGDVHIAINASSFILNDQSDSVPLGFMKLRAIGLSEFLPPGEGPVELDEIGQHPLLLLNKRHVTREIFDAACRVSGLAPMIGLETSSPHTLLAIAAGGGGIAVVPSATVLRNRSLSNRAIALGGKPLDFEIAAIWPKSAPLTSFGRAFVTMLENHITDVAADGKTARDNIVVLTDRRR